VVEYGIARVKGNILKEREWDPIKISPLVSGGLIEKWEERYNCKF